VIIPFPQLVSSPPQLCAASSHAFLMPASFYADDRLCLLLFSFVCHRFGHADGNVRHAVSPPHPSRRRKRGARARTTRASRKGPKRGHPNRCSPTTGRTERGLDTSLGASSGGPRSMLAPASSCSLGRWHDFHRSSHGRRDGPQRPFSNHLPFPWHCAELRRLMCVLVGGKFFSAAFEWGRAEFKSERKRPYEKF
jgi:hypothetical protein